MTKVIFIVLFASLFFSCQQEIAVNFMEGTWVDMSHSYEHQTPYWPTASGFEMDTVFAGRTELGYYYSAYEFKSAEHGGTHIDAPVHFAEGKNSVDELTIEQLTGVGIVIDVRDSTSSYIDYRISIEDFKEWESEHGVIPDGAIILLNTGFSKFWPDKEQYMGTSIRGTEGVALLHFPGLHADAAQWLVENRKIKAIGIDTPSIDYGRSSDFMSHRILMEKDIPAFENVANISELPAKGAFIFALPMKIKGGSGGPLRIAAFIPNL